MIMQQGFPLLLSPKHHPGISGVTSEIVLVGVDFDVLGLFQPIMRGGLRRWVGRASDCDLVVGYLLAHIAGLLDGVCVRDCVRDLFLRHV
jgi:hypothetical protein